MKVKLNRTVNLFGLNWQAGEYEVDDPFWVEALSQAAEPAKQEEEKKASETVKKRGR